jgi:hypothetical protein
MKTFIATALVLTAAIVSPALAQQHAASAARAKALELPYAQNFSPYQHHAEYDVYVNGEYAGSDPDPRIREELRQEWRPDINGD